jgi:hypothetical protein
MDYFVEICKSYYQAKRCFINQAIHYNRTQNRIDLLVIDTVNQAILDCDVKVYLKNYMTESKFSSICRNLLDVKRELKVKSFISDDLLDQFLYHKYLITTWFTNQDDWIKRFEEKGIQVLFINDIIKEMQDIIKNKKMIHDDAIVQLIDYLQGT